MKIIFGILVVMIIMFLWSDYSNNTFKDSIMTLTRQAARWSTAAKQDNNIMVAVLHANYGAGYLWALKDIAKDNEIEKTTGIDIKKFTHEITKIQDEVTKRLAKTCPGYAPEKTYLTTIAGEGN